MVFFVFHSFEVIFIYLNWCNKIIFGYLLSYWKGERSQIWMKTENQILNEDQNWKKGICRQEPHKRRSWNDLWAITNISDSPQFSRCHVMTRVITLFCFWEKKSPQNGDILTKFQGVRMKKVMENHHIEASENIVRKDINTAISIMSMTMIN